MKFWRAMRGRQDRGGIAKVLILTPVKDAAACVEPYRRRIESLTYPHDRISIGLLESDSSDQTWNELQRVVPLLRRTFSTVALYKRDFGYRIPLGIHRAAPQIQGERRAVMARSRNHLLFAALGDEDWVLWMDIDLIEHPPNIVERLLATGKDIVQPHCVLDRGGPTFDKNAWSDRGLKHMDQLRGAGDLVELESVGGSMLLVRADIHRDGLIFPAFSYGRQSPRARSAAGEIETEGLAMMAYDMGHSCWGMPNLEIRHRRL